MPELLISADCHVTEPLDLWLRGLPPGLRARGPRVELRDGRTCLLVEDRVARKLPPLPGGGSADALPRFWRSDDTASRVAALDQDGVWAEVVYPNLAFFCVFAIEDPELERATCRVYNDWLAELAAGSPRVVPIGLVPVRDLAAARAELEHLRARGLRGGLLPALPDFRPYNDPAWEPVWEAAEALALPLSFHAGTGRSQTPAHGPGAAVVNYVVTVASPLETVAWLCGAGVLERHPGLRVGMIECGAGWLAWALEAMDDAYREHHAWVSPRLAELPSAYFRRQGFVTFQRDPIGIANAERTGARCLLWGSDHPHPEGTFPHSRRVVEEQLRGVPRETAERIAWRNAAEIYAIPLPDGERHPAA